MSSLLRWLLFLVFPLNVLIAQTPEFRCDAVISSGFRYSADTASAYFYNYQVLRELGKEHLREVRNVKLRCAMRALPEVGVKPDGQVFLSVRLTDLSASGNTSFRGFDLAEFLIPSTGKIEVIHRNKSDSLLAKTFTFEGIPLRLPETTLPVIWLTSFDPATDTILVRMASPTFDEEGLQRLRERINLISDYYASASILDTILGTCSRIRTDSLAKLPFYFCDILELSKATDLILSRGFDSALHLPERDPRALGNLRLTGLRLSRSLIYNFLDRLDQGTAIPCAITADSLACYYVDGLIRYIHLSSLMGDLGGNIYHDYLDRYFTLASFPDEGSAFSKMVRLMWPEGKMDTLLPWVSGKVFSAYLLRARQLVGQHRYAAAVELTRHAGLFREHSPWLEDAPGTEAILSEAAEGVYGSYLGIAASSIGYGKLAMAEEYIRKALDYRQANESLFANGSGDRSAVEQLYRLIAGKRDTAWHTLFGSQEKQILGYLEEQKFDSAFSTFDELKVTYGYLADDTSESRRYRSLQALLLPEKYRICNERGNQAVVSRDLDHAWTFFAAAEDLAVEMNLAHDSCCDENRKAAFRYHQMEEIASRTGYIWADQFDSAWLYLAAVKEKIHRYGLAGDSALEGATDRYRNKILHKECMNRLEAAEILMLRASRNAEAKRYTLACSQFSRAGVIADSLAGCGGSVPGVSDSTERYRIPAIFQDGLDTLQFLYITGRYEECIHMISKLSTWFREGQLERFGLDSVSMIRMVTEKNNPLFTLAAARAKLNDQRPLESLSYLKIAREQGAAFSETASLQSALGTALAGYDRQTGDPPDCRQALLAHGIRDKWFKQLAYAYCHALQ